jgi:poly(ribitol-phosphate) beta-N-acetylglucosaminyltransferase
MGLTTIGRMNSPVVSFCIPTHQRSRYLASLLESLQLQLADFPYAYEVVIADNASADDTPAVVARFAEELPIRSHRHAHNIGGFPNWQFVMSQARGRYIVYVSDDDSILGAQVAETIAKMEADPQIVVTYAPWLLYDLVAQQPQGQFYEVPHDLRIERGAFAQLLDHILRHHIFPEVQIVRRDMLQRLQPRINEHAFFAFVHAGDYLKHGAVLIQRTPFYVAITNYFADETRQQLGNQEVETAWDRYRGGLEYLLAQADGQVSAEERIGLSARIQQMIAVRMSVAIRLRHHGRRNPVDTHLLALRLRGMGYDKLLPVPMDQLASQAMLHFLLHDEELHRGMEQMLCVGRFDAQAAAFLTKHAPRPVEMLAGLESLQGLSNTLVFVSHEAEAPPADEAAVQRNVRVLHEADLLLRFGL